MNEAIYGLLGTLAGALITGLVTLLTNGHQRELRRLELAHEAKRKEADRRVEAQKGTSERYAVFLSGCWQAKRFVDEIVDALRRADSKAIERINAIIASAGYQSTLSALNDGLGWIGITCHDPATEAHALQVSSTYDNLMDAIARD